MDKNVKNETLSGQKFEKRDLEQTRKLKMGSKRDRTSPSPSLRGDPPAQKDSRTSEFIRLLTS